MKRLANICLLIFNPYYVFPYIFRPTNIWEIAELPAVTRFDGIEEYYIRRRSQYAPGIHPQEVTKPEKKANIKKRICKSVFSSPYFKLYDRDWVDTDEKGVRVELEEGYRDIFNRIFKRNETSSLSDCEYENAYTSRAVRVKGIEYAEYGFSCLVRENSSKNIEEYVVSREYNVNLLEDKGRRSIAGRFIFAHDDRCQLTILAMAEESALELLPWVLGNPFVANILNLAERYDEDLFATLTENPDLDPVCQLEDGFKLRLCAVLFGAGSFKNKLTFPPTMSNVLPICKKKTISIIGTQIVTNFLDEYIRPSWGRIFEEWVIGCRAEKNTTGDDAIYYVSRGTWYNTVFMYKDVGNKNLSTYNYFYNVSVVDD